MGCGASTPAAAAAPSNESKPAAPSAPTAPPQPQPAAASLVLLVRSARSLRHGSDMAGKADPYCLVRVGPKGSSFGAKDAETERCSRTIFGTYSPVWNMAAQFESLPSDDAEVHVVVMDRDFYSPDDILGQARVPVSTLTAAAQEFPLASSSGTEQDGFVTLAGGVADELLAAEGPTGWLSELLGAGEEQDESVFAALGQYYAVPPLRLEPWSSHQHAPWPFHQHSIDTRVHAPRVAAPARRCALLREHAQAADGGQEEPRQGRPSGLALRVVDRALSGAGAA